LVYNSPVFAFEEDWIPMPAPTRSAALFLALALTLTAVSAAVLAADSKNVDFQWNARVPMRDGVSLSATIFRPAGQKEPLPVLFTLTPYVADSYEDRAIYFARHGYVYALVDVRGRGNSEGVFDPFAQEARDGYDAVEWLARQPWSNGKVAMWGGSYAGFDQWTTAKERPPHLVTIVPAAAVHPGVDFPFWKGIFYSYDMQWLTFTSGKAKNTTIFGEGSLWSQKFRELDQVVGNPSPVFQRWLSHPSYDAYWRGMVPTPEQYAQIDLPILTITGHYDADQPGALTYYRAHMRYGSPAARDRHYLILGPWDHAGTRTPNPNVGGLTFDKASVLDLNALHKEWYDWTMKNGPRPSFLEKRVSYYATGPGAERWKRADTLEEIGATRRTLYLGSDGGQAGDAFHSGHLAPAKPTGEPAPDRYLYDPLDVRPGQVAEEDSDTGFLVDQQAALDLFGNGAVYHSEPFAEATEVSGQVKLTLWLSLDVPDTDLTAALYEILPNGGSVRLTVDYLRARYRDSTEKESLVPSGQTLRYDFTGFTWFSRRIAKGSRLRLVISSPNTPGLEKNYNSGGVVAGETAKDARTAHVTVYHDRAHPSALEIPVVP
jgi:putative CocE/NonD family hydrolase